MLHNHEWIGDQLSDTVAETVIDGAKVARPLVRQFILPVGADLIFRDPDISGLMAWNPEIQYDSMSVDELPETAYIDQGSTGFRVRWTESFDDGHGEPALFEHYSDFSEEGSKPVRVGLNAQSYSAHGPRSGQRTSFGFEVTFDEVGMPKEARKWDGPNHSEVTFTTWSECSDGTPPPWVGSTRLIAGAVFADEVLTTTDDVNSLVQAQVARKWDAFERMQAVRRQKITRLSAITGVAAVALAGSAGLCSALCENQTQFERGFEAGIAYASGLQAVIFMGLAISTSRKPKMEGPAAVPTARSPEAE